MFPPINEQMDVIRSLAVEVLPENELVAKLERSIKNNKPLIIKLGCDPSKPDLHIGHAVVLNKLRQFQDLGHIAALIVGDFTAMIGDPSGKSKTRPQLTLEETRINGQSYLEQAGKVLSQNNLQVRYNSEWLSKMNFNEVIALSAKYTVAQLLERDDFSKRYKAGEPISVHELLYPLAQAMDSAEIKSDVELGGTDQKFNLIVGREIQKAYGVEQQCIVTMPILEGTDGIEKMSKSLDNYIAITDTPKEIFGKVMSIPDNLIIRYYKYAAFGSEIEAEALEKALANGSAHPRHTKADVAKRIVAIYHGEDAGRAALEEFDRIFKEKGLPDEILEIKLEQKNMPLIEILIAANLVVSKNEARKMLQQNAVSIDGEKITDPFAIINIEEFRLFKVGKRKFARIKKI